MTGARPPREARSPGRPGRSTRRRHPDAWRRSSVIAFVALLMTLQGPVLGEHTAIGAPPDDPATLTIEMQTIRSSIPSSVSVTDAAGQLVADASLATDESLVLPDLTPGTYTIAQTLPDGGSSRIRGIECSNGVSSSSNTIDVDLAAAANVTCTITNDPQTSTTLEVAVVLDWSGAAEQSDQTFEICIAGPSYPTGTEAGACQIAFAGEPAFPGQDVLAWDGLEPGEYDVTQVDPGADWQVVQTHQNPVVIPGLAEIPGEPARAGFVNSYSPTAAAPTTVEPPRSTTAPLDLPSTGPGGAVGMSKFALVLVAVGGAVVVLCRRSPGRSPSVPGP